MRRRFAVRVPSVLCQQHRAAICRAPERPARREGHKRTEFDVTWMPPPQEIGRLEVYVAAVAANGDGTDQGDYVYTYTQTLANAGTCTLGATPLFQQCVKRSVIRSRAFPPLSMVSIFGSGFQTSGRTRTAGLGDYVNGAFPTELGCVGVEVTGPGVAQPVQIPIAFVSFGQINAQMPEFPSTGPVTLTVRSRSRNAATGSAAAVATLNSLQLFAPAFFVFPNSMSIAAEEAGTGSTVADSSVVAGASPAKPGDVVSLFGTGFGDVNPAVARGNLPPAWHRSRMPLPSRLAAPPWHHPTFSMPAFPRDRSAGSINLTCEFQLERRAAKFR